MSREEAPADTQAATDLATVLIGMGVPAARVSSMFVGVGLTVAKALGFSREDVMRNCEEIWRGLDKAMERGRRRGS